MRRKKTTTRMGAMTTAEEGEMAEGMIMSSQFGYKKPAS